MPDSPTILVTGASGYVASWVVHELLTRGLTVRGTVRDPANVEKTGHLRGLGDALPGTLELFAADLLEEGSFDAAMRDVDIVIHTASPFHTDTTDPQRTLVDPALKGTRNVLEQVNATPSVTRVVLTSSVVSVTGDAADVQGRAVTEDDWNTTSSLDYQPYNFSKTVAEKEAWRLHDAQDRWSLAVLNPAFVMGPSLSTRTGGTSVSFVRNNLKGQFRSGTMAVPYGYVDVRDVAFAHAEAALRPDAEGRHILSGEVVDFYQFGQVIERVFPGRYPVPKRALPKWLSGLVAPFVGFSRHYVQRNVGHALRFDTTRARERLGVVFRPLEETVRDHVEQLERDGLV